MKHWPEKTLGELCDVRIGRTPRRDEPRFWGGTAVWVTVGELNGGEITGSKETGSDEAVREGMPEPVPRGTLLFSFKLSIGKMAVSGCPLYTNEAIAALPIRNPCEMSRDFLRYALMAESREGTADNAVLGKLLNKEKVQRLRVPVPPPAEQERLVKLLDEADAIRRLGVEADKRTDALIPALFHEMFGDPGAKSKRWPTQALHEVVEFGSGATPSKEVPAFWRGRTPWVSPKDMKADEIVDAEDHVTEAAFAETNLRLVPKDTVLVVVRGMILAHTIPIRLCRVPVAINQDMKALLPKVSVDPEFLRWSLQSQHSSLLKQVSMAGHGTKKLDTERLMAVPILQPPAALQKEFSFRVAETRRLEGNQAASRRRLGDLFRSTLYHAFAGEL
jgi:type I restriction enzyme, S subunit